MTRVETGLAAICLLTLLAAGEAAARTRYVATNGVDPLPNGTLDACGASFPCRTLNHAIQASQPGDTIQVGPGRYDAFAETPPVGCECLILVDQELRIVSRDGAYTTLIDAGGADVDAVRIDAANVVFGTRKHGFTVTGSGAGRSGVFSAATGLQVAGNVAYGNGGWGFFLQGSEQSATGNVAIGGGVGFLLEGAGSIATGNLALGNTGIGFDLAGSGVVAQGNVASLNGDSGFELRGLADVLTKNVSVGNSSGFSASGGSDHILQKSSIIGNGTGLVIDAPLAASSLNVYGSGDYCGGFNNLVAELAVPDTFWGAASGPGELTVGPADSEDCGLQTIDADPFASREIRVVPKLVNKFLP